MTACPTTEQLQEFLAEELSSGGSVDVETHIEQCQPCRDLLAQLSQDSSHISQLEFPRVVETNPNSDGIRPEFLARMKNRQFHAAASSDSSRTFDTVRDQLSTHATLPSIPGYELFAEIGRGGMGVVYKAKHLGLKRLVALKMLLGSQFESEDSRQRFRREAQAIGRLQHPNVVQVYDFGETPAGPFFSLELMESGSLSRRLDGTPWNPDAAARFVERLAWAIQFAHEQGIIHRDLKPSNILLQHGSSEKTADGSGTSTDSSIKLHPSSYVPKISDFGLAKFTDDDEQKTANGVILGTPSYLAPEQSNSHLGKVGPTTDVYGLGAILYELLTGWPPFRGNSVMTTLLLVTHQEPVRPSRLNARIPLNLETICLKCLEKSPAKRFASAGLLAEDLHRFLAGEPVLARSVGPMEKVWRWCRRKPVVSGLLAAILVITLVGIAGIATAWRSAEQGWHHAQIALDREISANQRLAEQKTKTENALYVQKLALAHHEWLGYNVRRANELLAECPLEQRSWEWQYLHRLCNDELVSLNGHKFPVSGVAFSSDGQKVATVTGVWPVNALKTSPVGHQPGEIRIWDAASGTELFSCHGHTAAVMGVAFSPDCRYFATASFDRTARLWDASTGEERFVFHCPQGWVYSVAFSPDGARLATGAGNLIQVWDTASGNELLSLRGHTDSVHSVAFTPDGQRLVSGSRDATVKIWPARTEDRGAINVWQRTIAAPQDVRSLAVSPDGLRVAAGGYDSVVKVFDLDTGTEIATQRSHATNIRSVAISPDGRTVASADYEGRVLLWDVKTTSRLRIIRGHAGGFFSVAFSSDGRHLMTGGIDGTAKIWDVTSEQAFRELPTKDGWLRHLTFSPDSHRLAAAGGITSRVQQSSAKIWNLASGRSMQFLKGHTNGVTATAFDPPGIHLATSSIDHSVKIWLVHENRNVETLKGHTDVVTCVAYSPDGKWIASGSTDRTVRIWNAAIVHSGVTKLGPEIAKSLPKQFAQILPAGPDIQPDRIVVNSTSGVSAIAFSPNGRWLAMGGQDGTIRLTDVQTGDVVVESTAGSGAVSSLAFSPDGRSFAASGHNKSPRVWDVTETNQGTIAAFVPRLLNGHIDDVFSVAFSADGRRLASASMDDTIRLWDVASGHETIALRAPAQGQTAVAFSPNGHTLASGSSALFLWEAVLPDRSKPEWIKAWHHEEYERAKTDQHWFAVAFHLSRILEFDPDAIELYRERAEALLFVKEWSKAAADLKRYLQTQPGNLDLQFRRAAACLLADDPAGYRDVLEITQNLFGETRLAIPAYYVVRMRTLMLQTPEENARALNLVSTVLSSVSRPVAKLQSGAELHAIAMTQFRAHDYNEALRTARVSMAAEPRWNARQINRFVCAMALHKLDQTDAARQEFDAVVAWIAEAKALPANQNPQIWGLHTADWLSMQILRGEAEQMLGITRSN